MDMNARIAKAIEERRGGILDLSRRIHADPELAFEEVRTSRLLRTLLKDEGFDVRPAADALPTAFRAVHDSGADRPRVTFTAEMDALPGLGHACGHNIIGTAGAYAAIVLNSVMSGAGGGATSSVGGGGKHDCISIVYTIFLSGKLNFYGAQYALGHGARKKDERRFTVQGSRCREIAQ